MTWTPLCVRSSSSHLRAWASLGLALVSFVLVGCREEPISAGTESPTRSIEASPYDASRQLAAVEVRGGLCATGDDCSLVITINADGAWTAADNGRKSSGTLDPGVVDALRRAVAETGLDDAPAATGCASAADGSEVTYTWDDGSGAAERASSCEVSISESDPLAAWFSEFRGASGPLSATP